MKVCVIGAGAIGGLMGAKLALAGEEVTVVDQGAHLKAIQQNGLKLIWHDGTEHVAKIAKATDKVESAGKQDLIILALKAHYLEQVARQLPKIVGPDTMIVTVQNGIPWWYFHKHGGELEGTPVKSVDPDGTIARHIAPGRIIASVVYPAANLVAPGVVQVVEGNRFSLGELDGSTTERIQALAASFISAGFKAPISRDIRGEIWVKLWGNLSFNPLSALTHATLQDICRYPLARDLAAKMMGEAESIAKKLGVQFRVSIERRIEGAEKVGAHKTSMLQDIEQGRPIELEALLGSVVELGALTGTPTPHLGAIYACASLLAHTLQAQGGKLKVQSPKH